MYCSRTCAAAMWPASVASTTTSATAKSSSTATNAATRRAASAKVRELLPSGFGVMVVDRRSLGQRGLGLDRVHRLLVASERLLRRVALAAVAGLVHVV